MSDVQEQIDGIQNVQGKILHLLQVLSNAIIDNSKSIDKLSYLAVAASTQQNKVVDLIESYLCPTCGFMKDTANHEEGCRDV